MNEYIEAVWTNIKRSVRDFFCDILDEVKAFFGSFLWIIQNEWGWREWVLVSFFALIAFAIGMLAGRI